MLALVAFDLLPGNKNNLHLNLNFFKLLQEEEHFQVGAGRIYSS